MAAQTASLPEIGGDTPEAVDASYKAAFAAARKAANYRQPPKAVVADLAEQARKAHAALVGKAGKAERPARAASPGQVFLVDGREVGASQNTLSHVARVTATKTEPRWPAPQLRDWLAGEGVADLAGAWGPVTLPNGRTLEARLAEPAELAEQLEATG